MNKATDSEITINSFDNLDRLLNAVNFVAFPSLSKKHVKIILGLLNTEYEKLKTEPIKLTITDLKCAFPSSSSPSSIGGYVSRALKDLSIDGLIDKRPLDGLSEVTGRTLMAYSLRVHPDLSTVEEFKLEPHINRLIATSPHTLSSAVNKVKALTGMPASFELTTLSLASGARISNRDKRLETKSQAVFSGETVNITSYTTGKTDYNGQPIGRAMTSDLIILSLLQARDMEHIQKELDNQNFDIPNLFKVDCRDLAKELRTDGYTEIELNNAYRTVSLAIQRIAHMSHEIKFSYNSDIANSLSDYTGDNSDTLYIRHIILQASGSDELTKLQRHFTYSYPEHVFKDMKRCIGLVAFPKKLLHRRTSSYDAILYYWLRSICSVGQSFEASLWDLYQNITRSNDVTWKHFSDYLLDEMEYHSGISLKKIEIEDSLSFDFYGYDINVKRLKKNNKSLLFTFTGSRIAQEVNYTEDNFSPLMLPAQ